MKTKHLLLLILMFITSFYVNAQYTSNPLSVENQYPGDSLAYYIYDKDYVAQYDSTTTASRTTWITNRFRDNWFISINGGIAQLMSEETRYMKFGDQIKPTLGIAFGKWFSPALGLRLSVTGAKLQGFATWTGEGENGSGLGDWYIGKNYSNGYELNRTNNYLPAYGVEGNSNAVGRALIYNRFLKGGDYLATDHGNGYTYDFTYIGASIDFLLNLKNLFRPYNHKAFFNPVLYGGIGYAHTLKDGDRTAVNSIMEKVGLQLNFRLSDRWDLFADGQMLFVPENFDRRVGDGNTMDMVGNYTLGLTYRINFRHFIKAPLRNQAEIDALNAEINALRNRPEVICPPVVICPECPEVIDTLKTPIVKDDLKFLPTPVFFLINSSVVRDNQMMSITKAAEFLRENPKERIKLTGYADKQTGTPAINKRLSEQRAKSVADILVKQYGIDRSRLEVSYMGDAFQPFAENDWNRVVIFVVP